ncbi:MAG: DUF748 domain-containing protein [Gemmatimonadota bacterium]
MQIPRKLTRASLIAAGVLAVIFVGLALGIPAAVRWGIESAGSREIGRQMHVGEVRFNPFTLKATLRQLSIAGLPDELTPLLSVDALGIDLSIVSLRHLAPVIEALQAHGVHANIVRLDKNRFNFSDIVDRLQAKPASPEPARFALYNVELDDAAIAFDDRVLKAKHTLDAIKLGIPFISSLPDDVQIKVKPAFSARLDGDPIALTAEAQPFDASLDTSVALKLTGIELPRYLGYLPLRPNFDLKSGTLDTDLHVHFRRATAATKDMPARAAQLSISGKIALRDIAYATRGGTTLVSWRRLDVDLADLAPLESHAKLRTVVLDGAQTNVVRSADGTIAGLDATRQLFLSSDSPPQTGSQPSAAKPFIFDVEDLQVREAAVDFKDEGVGYARRIAPIALELKGLSNRPEATAKLTASLAADDQSRLGIQGDVAISPVKLALAADLSALPLKSALPYLRGFTTARLDGNVDAGARVLVESAAQGLAIRVEDAHVEAKSVRMRDGAGGTAAFDLAKLAVTGGEVDVLQRTATVKGVRADGLRLIAARRADGTVDWEKLVARQESASQPGKPSAPWKVRVGEVQVNGGRIQVVDQAAEPEARLVVDNIALSLRDLSSEGRERSALSLRARAGGGSLSTRGWMRIAPLATDLAVDIQNIDVGALRPYLKAFTSTILTSASVWAKGKLAVDSGKAAADGALQVAYDGSARVTNLALLDSDGESELLRWQALDLGTAKLRVGAGAPEFQTDGVKLSDFYARVILSAEGRLNLVDVFKSPGATDANAAAQPALTPPPTDASATARPLIRVGGIELIRGNINYTDNFVKPNYTANLTDLGGTVSALASDTESPADVSIRGRVDGDAPVEITGKVNPLAPKLFLDIAGSAKGVELPRLTPYSVKYAGYPITKGKLSMDVRYHVENQQLKAENHLFLDQLTFGDRVESPTATKLPVLFAVSLLKNRRGEIDINLPISGSLDDPKFSIGGIIVRVIVNLIVKAVTAPFSLLASAFGGGEELGYLEFRPGTALPAADEAKKLDTLAKALNDRPALRLEITGRVDPAVDTEPLRLAKLDAKLRAAKVREIVRSGESVDPATVTITDAERPALIARVYDDEKIPNKPRNIIGIAKSIPAAEMEKLILSTISVDEQDLRKLANDRATAVRDRLDTQGKVPRERIFLVAPKLNAEGIKDKGRTTRVDFSLK